MRVVVRDAASTDSFAHRRRSLRFCAEHESADSLEKRDKNIRLDKTLAADLSACLRHKLPEQVLHCSFARDFMAIS